MPIKAKNRCLYPKDWPEISRRIRRERAKDRCECTGECGRQDRHTERCAAVDSNRSPYTGAIVVLTVAHLNHDPADCRDDNLKAMCQACHLALDLPHHQKNAAATRRSRKASGDLFDEGEGCEP